MAYGTASITNANPALTLVAAIETLLTTAGWVFVEEVVITTVTHRVMKNPAANNVQGADFFFASVYTTSGGLTLSFRTFEVWDATNKKAIRYYTTASSGVVPGVTPPYTYAVNDAVGVLLSSGSLGQQPVFTLNTTGFTYWLHASADHFQLATTVGGTQAGIYIGLYDDFMAPADSPFPLAQVVMSSNSSGSASGGGATREPKQAGAASWNFHVFVTDSGGGRWTQALAVEGYSGKPAVGRVLLQSARGASYWRGLLKNSLVGGLAGSIVNGDTFTFVIGGVTSTYVRACGASGDFWMPTT